MPKKGGASIYYNPPTSNHTIRTPIHDEACQKKKDSKIYRKTIDKKNLTYENKSMKLPEMIQTRKREWRKRRGGEGKFHTFRHFQDFHREVTEDPRSLILETCKLQQ